jgi:hypothetical protein
MISLPCCGLVLEVFNNNEQLAQELASGLTPTYATSGAFVIPAVPNTRR